MHFKCRRTIPSASAEERTVSQAIAPVSNSALARSMTRSLEVRACLSEYVSVLFLMFLVFFGPVRPALALMTAAWVRWLLAH